jgi:uncharacterized protein YdaU (DUF1376 family)
MANGTGYWFTHDYNARNDSKIKKLIKKHGMSGYGIYWALVEDLYNNSNKIQLDYETIAYDLRVKEVLVKSIITDFDLFEMHEGTLQSKSVERRLDDRKDKSVKASEAAKKRWRNADAMQTHSDSNAIKGDNIKGHEITEEKIKVDDDKAATPKTDFIPESKPEKKPPSVPLVPPIGEAPLTECAEWYKSNAYTGTRETICMANHIDMETLLDWLAAFTIEKIGEGKQSASISDFARHFANWMKYQDMKKNPKNLIHEKKDGQSTNINGNKNPTGAKVLNADYKADLLKRMAGTTDNGGNGGG